MSSNAVAAHSCSKFNDFRAVLCHFYLCMRWTICNTYCLVRFYCNFLNFLLDFHRKPGRLSVTHLYKVRSSSCNLIRNLKNMNFSVYSYRFYTHFRAFHEFLYHDLTRT